MTDQLAKQFASLKLSKSPTSPNDTSFNVIIDSDSSANGRDGYRVSMNPKDMTPIGLGISSFVILNGIYTLPVWPNLVIPPKSIRISSLLSKTIEPSIINQSITLKPCERPLAKPEIIHVKILDEDKLDLTTNDKVFLSDSLRMIPCFQTNYDYHVNFAKATSPIKVRFVKIEPMGSKVYGPCRMNTKFIFENQSPAKPPNPSDDVQIGGLEVELDKIVSAIKMGQFNSCPEFRKFKVKPPKGILLYGPPGTGKTLLAKAVSRQLTLNMFSIDGSTVLGQYYGESERKIREVFEIAEAVSPSIIFIDEIDALCPRRDQNGSTGTDARVVATLLTLMDGLDSDNGKVFVLAATNSPNSIDPALRRPGRFDFEIEIGIPNSNQRRRILSSLLSDQNIDISIINEIADKAHGFVGADLSLVVKEAALLSLQSQGQGEHFKLSENDLRNGFGRVKPSAIREVLLEVPKVYWQDIGGQEETKQKLKESVEWPLRYPEKFVRFGIKPPKGVLLYGPPGCSKTLLAKALATESGLNFMAVKGPELFSKWVGDSEKAIREIFRKARLAAPSIIFFDEFDAIGSTRSATSESSVQDRVLSQLLSEMDGADPLTNVTVVAATNRPDIIDPALLRPGRFDRHIYVSLPDLDARRQIFDINSKRMPFSSSVDFEKLVEYTQGFSGAEVTALCQEAAMQALKEDASSLSIQMKHFELARQIVAPRTLPSMLRGFEAFSTRKKDNR